MPTWLLILSSIAGGLLILGEIAIRLVTTLRPRTADQTQGELIAANQKLDLVREAVAGVQDVLSSDPVDAAGSQEMKEALTRIQGHVAPPASLDTPASPGFLGDFINSVTRQNAFLGVGIALLLVPALIAGGFNIGFDRFDDPAGSSESDEPSATRRMETPTPHSRSANRTR